MRTYFSLGENNKIKNTKYYRGRIYEHETVRTNEVTNNYLTHTSEGDKLVEREVESLHKTLYVRLRCLSGENVVCIAEDYAEVVRDSEQNLELALCGKAW